MGRRGRITTTVKRAKRTDWHDIDHINMWVYFKDKFNITKEAWHELAIKCKDMPTKYKICKHLDKLNANWNLKSTPGEAEGIQISFRESLEEQIRRLQKNGFLHKVTTVKVKISGDKEETSTWKCHIHNFDWKGCSNEWKREVFSSND